MIVGRRQAHYLIEHLERAVRTLTAENADLKAELARQAEYHEAEVKAQGDLIRKLYREAVS